MSCLAYCLGRTPGAPAQSASLVNRASSLNTFAGHGSLAQTVFWCSGPGLRMVKIGAFLHSKKFFNQMEKTDKMGDDPHIKKVPPRTHIS